MAPPACESESQAVEESDARGSKTGGPGGQIRPPGGPISRPGESQTTSWGVLGARSASGGRSGREKGSWKIVWRALGTVLGRSWRLLGQFRVAFPPPGMARGGHFWRYVGVIFGGILGAQAEKLNMSFSNAFYVCLGPLSILFFVLCCLPCCVAGGAVHMQLS